jgi:hypothetical protein
VLVANLELAIKTSETTLLPLTFNSNGATVLTLPTLTVES